MNSIAALGNVFHSHAAAMMGSKREGSPAEEASESSAERASEHGQTGAGQTSTAAASGMGIGGKVNLLG